MASKLFHSYGLILAGLLTGYAIRVIADRSPAHLPLPIEPLRRGLQLAVLLFVNPVAILGAVWIVRLPDIALAALPLLGLFAIASGGAMALLAAKALGHGPAETGSMFCCGAFTNIGSMGALFCFVLLGEPGFALVPLYKLFEEFSYYSVGFPIARRFGTNDRPVESIPRRLARLMRDPLIIATTASLAIGFLLNAFGAARPALYASLNAILIPLGTVMLLVSIGLAFRFRRVGRYLREGLAVSAIKLLLVPAAVSLAAWAVGFGAIDGGLPLMVVVILSSMPVAFTALVPPSLYGLNVDLANGCWLISTLLVAGSLPLLLFLSALL